MEPTEAVNQTEALSASDTSKSPLDPKAGMFSPAVLDPKAGVFSPAVLDPKAKAFSPAVA